MLGSILILYHSGVGSTKTIATILYKNLKQTTDVKLCSVEELKDISIINEYENLIIGFPTYHCSPSTTIQNFMKHIPKCKNKKKAFIFTTCGLFSANTLRIFAKQCVKTNIDVVYAKSYRSPASDGALVAPCLKIWFNFEKNIVSKLKKDADMVQSLFSNQRSKGMMPRFKLSSILNAPNKFLGQRFKPRIYLFKSHCNKCGMCVKQCPHHCFVFDENKELQHANKKCEHCYRCIHNCPNRALSVIKNRRVSKQLNEKFFIKKKSEINCR